MPWVGRPTTARAEASARGRPYGRREAATNPERAAGEMLMDPRPVVSPPAPADTLNILDFEPTLLEGDDLDITVSLCRAINAVPKANEQLPDRSEQATTILYPSLQGTAAFVL